MVSHEPRKAEQDRVREACDEKDFLMGGAWSKSLIAPSSYLRNPGETSDSSVLG